jgi:hypothetical protein
VVSDDACYRAMDWLHTVRSELEKQVYFAVADLLNLEVDLLFFDTTSTYFELDDADDLVARNWRREATDGADAQADKRPGSVPTASPRTAATTCHRSSSGWRSPGMESRSGPGAGPVTPPTRR